MRRLAFVPVLALLLALTAVPTAYAQACDPGAFPQADMAGHYVSVESQMRVEMYPCGANFVMWDNQYGRHVAAYSSTNRLAGGGIAATGVPGVGGFPNGSLRIGFKPAEPGYIEVITLGVYDETYTVHRLRKIL